ncbi:winged helix-turn-helix transcriptional regulator [bacterium]|nr:winged helix-turn-helix transcriptional regulator [bacterium]RQV97203.1 MAG: ArsR family transcriptional regulator [bacterium]
MTQIEDISEKLKAISDPTRLRILQLLSRCRDEGRKPVLCVNALANHLGITQSAVSQHLKILRQAGFVRSERHGYFIHYRLNPDQMDALCDNLSSILEKK